MNAYIQGNIKDLAAFLMAGDILQLPDRKHKFYMVHSTDYNTATIYLQPINESGEPLQNEPLEKF